MAPSTTPWNAATGSTLRRDVMAAHNGPQRADDAQLIIISREDRDAIIAHIGGGDPS